MTENHGFPHEKLGFCPPLFPGFRTKLRLVLGDVLPKGSDLANGLDSDLLQEDALAESQQNPDISVMRYLKMCFFSENHVEMDNGKSY